MRLAVVIVVKTDTGVPDDNVGHQLDIYECLEIVNAETTMVNRQGDAGDSNQTRSGYVCELHILRTVG